jgi:choice-of-anchor B domain-containing protein
MAAQSSPEGIAGSMIGYAAAIAFAGDELAVGRSAAVTGFPMPSAAPGVVYLYRRSGSGWVESGKLQAADATVGDAFGSSLVAMGNYLVVGAPGAAKRGAVYVFERTGGTWQQVARFSLPGAADGDRFGAALALAPGSLLVGAPGRDSGRGGAYFLVRKGNDYTIAHSLEPADRDSAGRFGTAVALDATRAFVGAPGQGGGMGGAPAVRGRVWAYEVDRGTLQAVGTITSADTTVASLGSSFALVEGAVWIGAPATARAAGAALRFSRAGRTWTESGRLVPAEVKGPMFAGLTITPAAGDLLVGAPMARGGSGSVLVFRDSGGTWSQVQQLEVQTVGLAGMFGSTGAASGDVAVFGAPLTEFFEGRAWTYGREAGAWKEMAQLADEEGGLPRLTGTERKCDVSGGDVAGFKCQQVDLLAFIPTRELGAPRGIMLNDIWGWTDPETKREYAIVGRMDGTSFVDVTDPSNPVFVADLPLTEGARPNLWRDMKVYKDHAFIVSDGAGPHGMQVFDLTRLRNVTAMPARLAPDTVYHGIFSAHNIAINEETGFAYAVSSSMGGETCGGALHMIDIREPKMPKFAGCYADAKTGNRGTGGTHDTQCVTYQGPDADYRGREICFNASETALGIADVTDKAAPRAISRASHPNTAYTHQGWLSADSRYFFVNDEGDEVAGTVPRTRTVVYDVTDLDDPVVATEFLGTNAASDHNLYIRGRYMFESNYVSGLRVIDIADPTKPVEVGYFDTVPFGDNVPGFAGSWSNYPYFPSGTIVVTSMREGLFVVRHRPEAPTP